MAKPSGTTRDFGIISISGLAVGGLIVNNLSETINTEQAMARGPKGQVIDEVAFSKQEEINVDGLYTGGTIDPGSIVDIGEKQYLVTNATRTEANTDFVQGSFTATRADNAILWPISSFLE